MTRDSTRWATFLWGVAGAGHQVEGGNVNADHWVVEHVEGTPHVEPSGDACDHYHRYRSDIELLAELGYTSYRFSLEWSRIEPERGEFSNAAVDHYRAMADECHERGITPVVTYNHFTTPRWFAAQGGWEVDDSVDRFTRYCAFTAARLGDSVPIACTLNEPNVVALIEQEYGLLWGLSGQPGFAQEAARVVGSDRFVSFPICPAATTRPRLLAAHRSGFDAIKSVHPDCRVGITLAVPDFRPVDGGEERCAAMREEVVDSYLAATGGDDFVGVQTYTRTLVGPEGARPAPDGAELTQMGYEFHPEALGGSIRYVAAATGLPVFVTENGIATDDDARRVEYLARAVASMVHAMRDGIDVVGYLHWSVFDNFEWMFGYRPTFGVIAVDRSTQLRTPKPSAFVLGALARAGDPVMSPG